MKLANLEYSFLKSFIVIIFLILIFENSNGQIRDIRLSRSYDQLNWSVFTSTIEKEFNVRFFYIPGSINDMVVHLPSDTATLDEVLKFNLESLGIKPAIDQKGNIFLLKDVELKTSFPKDFFTDVSAKPELTDTLTFQSSDTARFIKTANEYMAKTYVIGSKKEGVLLKKAKVNGSVKSNEDGSPIPGATIYVKELEIGTVTDNSGLFSLNLPKGKYSLVIRSVDCEEEKCKIELLSDGRLDLKMTKKVILMKEVTITSQSNHNVRGMQMGFERMTIKEIKEIPVVLGERDLIKVALLLPGVKNAGEGSSGFNVRGSPADQNMFYINNVPIYNTAHLFGFFSAFNPDVVSDFTLYKSNIPSKYGGRLSSIFEIHSRQGNQKKFALRGGISPITTRIMAEIPVVQDKVNLMIGMRSTYSDWILDFIKVPEVNKSSGQFGDIVSNLSIQANKNNQFRLFAYASFDKISLASKVNNNYSNMGYSASWFHTFNPNHELDLNLIYYKYNFNEQNFDYNLSAYDLTYQLEHQEFNVNFKYRISEKNRLNYGLSSVLYKLDNGKYQPYDEASIVEPVDLGVEKAVESALFLDDEWKLSSKLTVSAGLRYNNYALLGAGKTYRYLQDSPKIPTNITDTLYFEKNDIIKNYNGLDYRFSANYLVNPDFSVKFSYNTLSQYIFMLSNTIAIAPTDKWKLCDYNIKPMRGSQISVGIYSNMAGGLFETSIEGYIKKVNNLTEYRDGAKFIANINPEQDVLQGELDAYGIEFMIKKTAGKLNGWFNYSYSTTSVLVNNSITGEQTNFGIRYPANYDQPHTVNLVANYRFSKRLSLSGNLVYSTGRPATYPTSVYYLDGQRIISYSKRNEYRIPDYFRMDMSITLEGNLKKRKAFHGSWVFSIYNMTGRNNAYSVYFRSENGIIKGYKMSIFGTPIFSITYDFKLGNYAN